MDLPLECPLGDDLFMPRMWCETTYTWKASALCHKPLYFEQVQMERYGHTLGPLLDPIISGAHFFGTNRDPIFPMPDGPWPATGAVLAAVEVASGKQATVIGKPELPIIEVTRALLPPEARTAIVGDSLFSDIQGGKRAGIGTVLVLSGNTTQADLEASPIQPDFVLPSLASLL